MWLVRVFLCSPSADNLTLDAISRLGDPPPPANERRQEENAVWDQVQAKDACLRRLDERGFPEEMRALAEASDRFYELGVYYRNPLEVRYVSVS